MRCALSSALALALCCGTAAAQSISIDPNSNFPVLGFPTQHDEPTDTYRHLSHREINGTIHIALAAGTLYDFEQGKVRGSAADYLQQIANLIFEQANGPVRIECRSDLSPPAAAQKAALACAAALSQWLTVQERLTHVKFTTIGTSVPPPAAVDPNDPFAKPAPRQTNVTIDFAKK